MMRMTLIGLAVLLCAGPAFGQANPAAITTPGGTGPTPNSKGVRPAPSPPALPGARAEPTQVAPPSKNVGDLPPNEALFDAINRGDLASVKDAISRGAELHGKNVLGLTPTELAVDLGRNEISFYLLSLRGGLSGTTTTSGPGAEPKPPTRAERLAADREAKAERAAKNRRAPADALPPTAQTAKLFMGDGGSPVPQAGFLGFGSGR